MAQPLFGSAFKRWVEDKEDSLHFRKWVWRDPDVCKVCRKGKSVNSRGFHRECEPCKVCRGRIVDGCHSICGSQ